MLVKPVDPVSLYIDKYEEPEHHLDALMKASIITLDFRPRILFPLWNAGIKTVGELIRQHRRGLRGVGLIGTQAASEIERRLRLAGLIPKTSGLKNN